MNIWKAVRDALEPTEVKDGHRDDRASDRGETGAFRDPGGYTQGTVAPADTSPSLEVVQQEIIAWRGWCLSKDDHGPVLKSVTRDVPWLGPSLTADAKPGHRTPDPNYYWRGDNTSGIYALRELGEHYSKMSVVGSVALSGIVVEGENGYRAEHATIRSLRLRSLPDRQPQYQARYYGMNNLIIEPPEPPRLGWGRLRAWEVAALLAERYKCECDIDWLATSAIPADELTA